MCHRLPAALYGLSILGLLGWALLTRAEDPTAVSATRADPANDPARNPLAAKMLKIADEYVTWGRFDEQMRWAPAMCAGPAPVPQPSSPRFSDSGDKSTHGQKLYSLWVKDQQSYIKATADNDTPPTNATQGTESSIDQPGQIIVKESWTIKPAAKVTFNDAGQPPSVAEGTAGGRYSPYAKRDGKWFQTEKKSALFIMLRLDPATPGTDNGWVYGTVSPDGKQVTSIGQVQSCMGCHEQAKHGRLFGLPHTAM